MAGLEELTAQAIGTPNTFNWPWFVELCVCGIVALFFLFYFNRLFATLLSYGIRAYTWYHYRVWFDVQALQISLLGGRIFFKGVRYHGENETIIIHNGYLTWRYWFRNIRQVDLTVNDHIPGEKEEATGASVSSRASERTSQELDEETGVRRNNENSEARIAITVSGVEWFIYNRTPLYDAILRDDDMPMGSENEQPALSTGVASAEAIKAHLLSKLRRRPKSSDTTSSGESMPKDLGSEKIAHVGKSSPAAEMGQDTSVNNSDSTENDITMFQSLLIQLLPIYIECSRAAISIGNEHTRAILVTTMDRLKGHIDARGCGPDDLFRQMFEFDIEHPIIQMRPNPDFTGTQLSIAEHVLTDAGPMGAKRRWWRWKLDLQLRKHNAVRAFRNLVPGLQSSVESLHHDKRHVKQRVSQMPFTGTDDDGGEWHGLSRYLDENDADDHQAWTHIDYARFSTIFDSPSVHLAFYWDSPGRVKAEHLIVNGGDHIDLVNGCNPPAYGLDLTIRGGNLNYGPWTDRLRAELQSVFFPASYRSSMPAKPLRLGQWRQSTVMIIRVDVEEEVTLRVPTRESSKDWRWRGKATAVRDAAAIRKQRQKRHFRLRRGAKGLLGPDIRPFGWLSITVSTNSSIRYEMDLVARRLGYRNHLQLDLKNTKATSSVNHAELWRCLNHKIQCDISAPLVWNSQHVWSFNIHNESMDLFLLRDHFYFLSDLISDFTAGQKDSYMTFVPYEYRLVLSFDTLRLFLNANDFNIIDSPCDLDNNVFLIIGAHELAVSVDIPMKYYSTSQNSVQFRASGNTGYLDLNTPVWNTFHSFSKDKNMGTLKILEVTGSYNYHAGISSELNDSLFLDVFGGTPKFQLQGIFIRYIMNIVDNYFGSDVHFRTFEEYQNLLGADNRFHPEEQTHSVTKDNDLDVILNVRADNTCALMPANIYVRDEYLRVDLMLVEVEMRFTNYYMDLQVESGPIEISTEREVIQDGETQKDVTPCQVYISAVSVYGHRLFGAPPAEPTYVCNWDFDIGSIDGECSTQFLRILLAAGQAFGFTFSDEENALPVTRVTALHDIVFLRARVRAVEVWISTGTAALLVEAGQTTISFNDWAGAHFSKSLNALIPSITIAIIDTQGSLRWQDRAKHLAPTLACIKTSIQVVNIDKLADFENQRQLQQDHVKYHDLRSLRTPCLLHDNRPLTLSAKETQWSQNTPSIPVPDLPTPILMSDNYVSGKPSTILRQPNRQRASPSTSCSSHASKPERNTPLTSPYHSKFNRGQGNHLPLENSNSNALTTSHVNGADVDANKMENTKEAPFSSPWIGPHFPLHKLQPDLGQLPPVTIAGDGDDFRKMKDRGAEQDYTDSDESVSHAAIYCSTPNGVRVFCSPLVFPVLVSLLQDIAPRDPHSILDVIQQSTIASLRALTTTDQGQKLDFAVRIPTIAFRLLNNSSQTKQSADVFADQYDLLISRIRLNGRVAPPATSPVQGQTKANILLLQASVRDIEILVAERSRSDGIDAANLRASISDVEFWLSLQEAIRSNLQLDAIEVSTGGSTVDRLSMLVERTREMVTGIVHEFSLLDQAYAIRHLVYHLSLLNTATPDPGFLSKPSYVLRSAAEHIRLADSWKILSRFRQRLTMQSVQERLDLTAHNSCMFEQQQDKARQQIMESIDSWQTWDREHEACGPILAAIFGDAGTTAQTTENTTDLELGFYFSQISLLLDPGLQQSELVLQSGDLNISTKSVFEDPEQDNEGSLCQSRTRVQLWFADVALDLNWNLVELARSLVKQVNLSAAVTKKTIQQPQSISKLPFQDLDLAIAIGTDFATTKIRTINLNLDMAARSLKTSVVVEQSGVSSKISLLIASTSAHLKLASQYRKLFNWRLQAPNIYALYQQGQRSLNGSDIVRFAASSDRLRFDMKEDILTVLNVLNKVIENEVVVINDVIDGIEQQTVANSTGSKAVPLKLHDIHMALFLNNYKLRFCLLPSLHYGVVGAVARTSVVPQHPSKYLIHIDVKKNKHTFIEPNSKHRSSNATLEIPPLSSRLVLSVTEKTMEINASSTLERITIEADAVQACIEAAYKPQNLRCLKDCRKMVERIQHSLSSLPTGTKAKGTTQPLQPASPKILLYSGHVVFEGFDILCSAPAVRDQDYRADLRFGLRQITLKIHNHQRAKHVPLEKPQFEIGLSQAFLGLYKHSRYGSRSYGHFNTGFRLKSTTQVGQDGDQSQNYRLLSESTQLDISTETIGLVIDIATFLQGRIIELTTLEDRQKIRPLRRLTLASTNVESVSAEPRDDASDSARSSNIFDTTISLDLNLIRVRWIVNDHLESSSGRIPEDLVFSIRQINLQTQRESSAKLTILDTQLQTVSKKQDDLVVRTTNSALLPEMIFNAAHFSTKKDRRFAFQAAGKALDLRLAADGILPLSAIQRSLARATAEVRNAKTLQIAPDSDEPTKNPVTSFLGNKRLSSLLVDADFAGAMVKITPRMEPDDDQRSSAFGLLKGPKKSKAGRYGQAVQSDGVEEATLRAPGIAVKVEYIDTGNAEPTMSTEFKVAASSNTLAPSVVPLILEIYSSVKEMIGEDNARDRKSDNKPDDKPESKPDNKPDIKLPAQKYLSDTAEIDADPTAILGRVKLNAGLWVQRQEFSLTCQPIARVSATARFEEIFITINTVQDGEQERFFSIITTFNKLEVSVQHVYSRESTASFEVESIVMSLMNSKHISNKNGISAILNVSPMKASLNAKQMQDFLLFREIWYPAELRQQSKPPAPVPSTTESQAYAMQKYHELAATAALPWHAILSIQELKLDIDFGQSLGKASFMISQLWASSKKNSDWEQNLCIGFDRIGVDSSGRMSGFIELKDFHTRTSIRWPTAKDSSVRAPLVQASVGFGHLRLKTAFDYQPFAVADVSSFEFLMYNVRPTKVGNSDRLVGILNGGKVQVFCISTVAAQALSIVQAFERLFQEKKDAFRDSLHELDRLLRRKSIFPTSAVAPESQHEPEHKASIGKRESHRLHTDVVVTLNAIDIGAFPNSFFDNQILKIEAVDVQARFAVATVDERLRSGLGMTLGQVRVALSSVNRSNTKALGEVEIGEVIERATSSRGGTILRVPRLVASMQTWQEPQSYTVEYIFRSTFQGKVDVGWNYSRIRFIRGMWDTHSQALTHRLGKPLPPSAVKITAEPQNGSQEKITAVVNVPQSSKFQYIALEPPIIDTPQLRDMGEATPPLEWIGLHRDKLPNVTHSIVIVTLLEVAKEVEDAYTRILGSG